MIDSIDSFRQNQEKDVLYTLFIGGCGAFGMNMTAYIINSELYIVDVGLAFANDHEIGIDSYVPDLGNLVSSFGAVSAYFITHGHEDHVGALPLILERFPAPVYATAWTLKILEDRVRKFGSRVSPDTYLVQSGDTTSTGSLRLHWNHMPHSIPGCCSILMEVNDLKIFHTGDFKFDRNPPYEEAPDEDKLRSFAPITALISDSTNAQKDGYCPSESTLLDGLEESLKKYPDSLIVTTSFASNFWRLKTILSVAKKLGRLVFISGNSLFKTLEIAESMGYDFSKDVIIDEGQMRNLDRSQVLVIASGSQGEPRSSLRRIVFGEHRHVKLHEGDCIVFSSRVIPGNEKSVAMLVSEAHKNKILVETSNTSNNIHVSGHAHQEDLLALIDLLGPKFHVPVHGTFTQLKANAQLQGSPVSVENGSILRVSDLEIKTVGKIRMDRLFVDSWSQRPMSYESMRSRHKIGDSGLCIISGTANEIEIDLIGLPFDDDNDSSNCQDYIRNLISRNLDKHTSKSELNEFVRLSVRRHLSQRFVKKPVVMSKITL